MKLSPDQARWLDRTYRSHSQRVFLTCLRFALGDRPWAMDRTQEVFLRLAERLDELKNKDDPGGWLYRVSVHTCFMQLRRERGVGRLLLRLKGAGQRAAPSPAGQVDARLQLSELEVALRTLPPKQRAVMVMVYLEERSQTEAAQLLQLSKGQVSKLHKRALDALALKGWSADA